MGIESLIEKHNLTEERRKDPLKEIARKAEDTVTKILSQKEFDKKDERSDILTLDGGDLEYRFRQKKIKSNEYDTCLVVGRKIKTDNQAYNLPMDYQAIYFEGNGAIRLTDSRGVDYLQTITDEWQKDPGKKFKAKKVLKELEEFERRMGEINI